MNLIPINNMCPVCYKPLIINGQQKTCIEPHYYYDLFTDNSFQITLTIVDYYLYYNNKSNLYYIYSKVPFKYMFSIAPFNIKDLPALNNKINNLVPFI